MDEIPMPKEIFPKWQLVSSRAKAAPTCSV